MAIPWRCQEAGRHSLLSPVGVKMWAGLCQAAIAPMAQRYFCRQEDNGEISLVYGSIQGVTPVQNKVLLVFLLRIELAAGSTFTSTD